MSLVNGQKVNAAATNAAFVSKTTDSTTVGKLTLNKAAEGSQVESVQKAVNKIYEGLGTTGQDDADINNYANNNVILDGDSRKVAIEKLDDAIGNLGSNFLSRDANDFATTLLEKVTVVDDDIFILEDSEDSGTKKYIKKSNLLAIPTVSTFTVDQFSGDGVETIFTLSVDPVAIENTDVHISGVYQNKSTYTVVGTTLTFSEAPPADTNNIEVKIGSTSPTIETAQVFTDQFSGDGSTTVFSLSVVPASKDAVNVYVSGVYQQKASFSLAVNQITFTEAPPTGSNNIEITSAVTSPVASSTPSGVVLDFAGSMAPSGWLMCDGAAISRSLYVSLFQAIGTTFGVGDGSTTFNIPDTRGRTSIGSGTGTGLTARTLGQLVGEETHILTVPEMPSHTHLQNPHLHNTQYRDITAAAGGFRVTDITGALNGPQTLNATATNQNTGGGGAHNNMQPSIVFNKIIKL
jgi:microcystin-dependent protein